MKSVDIFLRADRFENAFGVDLLRHGQLDEDAMHFATFVELGDQREQFGLRRSSGIRCSWLRMPTSSQSRRL